MARSSGLAGCSPRVALRQPSLLLPRFSAARRQQQHRGRFVISALFGLSLSAVKPEYRDPNRPVTNYLYEPTTGLPVIREKLSYAELLEDIRTEKVRPVIL